MLEGRTSLQLADSFAQLLNQSLRGERKLDKLTGLEFDIAALQIRLYRLAQLIGNTNPFSRYHRQHSRRVLIGILGRYILVGRPGSVANMIQGIAKIGQKAGIEVFSREQ